MTVSKFHPYKERKVAKGQRVKVYRNLHNKMFSIVDMASGLVLGHSRSVKLSHAEFIVNEAGRQRVLREKQKNVHAFIVGSFEGTCETPQASEAYYNPYKVETFVTPQGEPLTVARSVTLMNTRVFYTL